MFFQRFFLQEQRKTSKQTMLIGNEAVHPRQTHADIAILNFQLIECQGGHLGWLLMIA